MIFIVKHEGNTQFTVLTVCDDTMWYCLYVRCMGMNVSSYFRDVEAGWSRWRYFNPESNILDFYCEGTFLVVF